MNEPLKYAIGLVFLEWPYPPNAASRSSTGRNGSWGSRRASCTGSAAGSRQRRPPTPGETPSRSWPQERAEEILHLADELEGYARDAPSVTSFLDG